MTDIFKRFIFKKKQKTVRITNNKLALFAQDILLRQPFKIDVPRTYNKYNLYMIINCKNDFRKNNNEKKRPWLSCWLPGVADS